MSRPLPPPEIESRRAAWENLSDLYVDADLTHECRARQVRHIAETPYSIPELWEILRTEVHPACRWNLVNVTGEWELFTARWIQEHLPTRPARQWPDALSPLWLLVVEKARKLLAEVAEYRENPTNHARILPHAHARFSDDAKEGRRREPLSGT